MSAPTPDVVNCDDFVIRTENPDVCPPPGPYCEERVTVDVNGIPTGVCVADVTPQSVVGVAPSLPATGPAPYAPTLGAIGMIAVMFGAMAVRVARR